MRAELLQSKICPETGNGFQLVQRPAGMTQAAAGNHRNHDAGRCRNRGADKAGFVAYAAGGMFIHLDAGNLIQVHDFAGPHHAVRQGTEFAVGHATKKRGHQEGGHLIIGNLSGGVTIHQKLDFFDTKLFACAFAQN